MTRHDAIDYVHAHGLHVYSMRKLIQPWTVMRHPLSVRGAGDTLEAALHDMLEAEERLGQDHRPVIPAPESEALKDFLVDQAAVEKLKDDEDDFDVKDLFD